MRAINYLLLFLAVYSIASAQPPAATRKKATPSSSPSATSADRQKLHESALKFMEASDVRHRVSQGLDKLLEDGRQSMMQKNPGLDPQFGEEWLKRMRQQVNLDDFVNATAGVYEKYFTAAELDELTRGQLAMRKSQIYSLPPALADKLKTNSPFIQRDINTETSVFGARLGVSVGKEIEKEHPEWIKPAPAPAPLARK